MGVRAPGAHGPHRPPAKLELEWGYETQGMDESMTWHSCPLTNMVNGLEEIAISLNLAVGSKEVIRALLKHRLEFHAPRASCRRERLAALRPSASYSSR